MSSTAPSLFGQAGGNLLHTDKLSSATLDATFQAGLELLDQNSWQHVKTIRETGGFEVEIHKHAPRVPERDKIWWYRRTSEHPVDKDLAYDEFRAGLVSNHATNEQQYVPDLKRVESIKVLEKEKAEIWLMQYKTPIITSDRDFAQLILSREQTSPDGLRAFSIVQIPVLDVPSSKSHVRGRYTSIEHVEELDIAGKGGIRWRMATASNAGGSLPQATTDLAMPGSIAHDVSNFILWAQKQRAA